MSKIVLFTLELQLSVISHHDSGARCTNTFSEDFTVVFSCEKSIYHNLVLAPFS